MATRPAIAIVGIGCRFPGDVDDVVSFWRTLCEGRDVVGDVPSDRIDLDRFGPEGSESARMVSARGGYLRDIDMFDADFFGVSPHEAQLMDPQQRLLLETAWEAVEDAGVDLGAIDRSGVGVFVGQWTSDFESRLFADPADLDFLAAIGSGRYASAGRISHALDLSGPSMTIDTACSSSLSAIHLATQSLRTGEADLALAGGANVILAPHIHLAFSAGGLLSPGGTCKFGDLHADGYVRSEGAAIVALKRLDDAVSQGDRIYAVLRGSASNNDGRGSGRLGRPSEAGQAAVLRRAYLDAGVSPASVSFVEAHGTGTRVGDRIEIGALNETFGAGRENPLLVGSLKSNFGHMESAAGVAGLVKAAMALRERAVPATLHIHSGAADAPQRDGCVEFCRSLQRLPETGDLFAGVSTYGVSGTNVHIVLQSAPPAHPRSVLRTAPLLPLSAQSDNALRLLAGKIADLLNGNAAPSIEDVCAHAQLRRNGLGHRAVFLGLDRDALIRDLRDFAGGAPAAVSGVVQEGQPGNPVFVCPGQIRHGAGIARELTQSESAFADSILESDAHIKKLAGWSLRELIHSDGATTSMHFAELELVGPALVALSIAYADMFAAYGLNPSAVVGQGVGEAAAAYIAGALTREDALRIACRRSKSSQGAETEFDAEPLALAPRPTRLAFISSVTGTEKAGEELDAGYWSRDMQQPLRFSETIKVLLEKGDTTLIELGCHTLTQPIEERDAAHAGASVVATCGQRDASQRAAFFTALAAAWSKGCRVRWGSATDRPAHVDSFPLHTWRRKRHWPRQAEQPSASGQRTTSSADNLEHDISRPQQGETAWCRRITSEPANRRKPVLVKEVCKLVEQVLGKPVRPDEPFREQGLNSLMAIEVRARLSSAAGRKLPATIAFDAPTVSAIADFLVAEGLFASGTAQEPEIDAGPPPATESALYDHRSEAELAEELTRRLEILQAKTLPMGSK